MSVGYKYTTIRWTVSEDDRSIEVLVGDEWQPAHPNIIAKVRRAMGARYAHAMQEVRVDLRGKE